VPAVVRLPEERVVRVVVADEPEVRVVLAELEALVVLEGPEVVDVLVAPDVVAVLVPVAPLVRVVRLPKVRSVDVEVVRAGPAVAPVRPPAEAPTCVWRVLRPGPPVWSERALVIPALRLEKLRSG
jgi:hypothetical protein